MWYHELWKEVSLRASCSLFRCKFTRDPGGGCGPCGTLLWSQDGKLNAHNKDLLLPRQEAGENYEFQTLQFHDWPTADDHGEATEIEIKATTSASQQQNQVEKEAEKTGLSEENGLRCNSA